MRSQDRLESLLDEGVIHEVLRPLLSGKEADVYLVAVEDHLCVAKLYKEAENRSFHNRSSYTEGRQVRNTRSQRAMSKRTSFGRAQEEEAWRTAEVDVIYKLRAAGVRVPEPYAFVDGVLVMELIRGWDGNPAPRLADVTLEPQEARDVFFFLLGEVVGMLLAGVVHGDLSDFNVLMGQDGPVIIDFPQAVDSAVNRNARRLLVRDVNNLTHFLGRWAPELRGRRYGEEMWALYERNQLTRETRLTGHFRGSDRKVDTMALLDEIAASVQAERARRIAMGLPVPTAPPDPPRRDRPRPEAREGQRRDRPQDERPQQEQRRTQGERPPQDQRRERPQGERPPQQERRPQGERPPQHERRPQGERPPQDQRRERPQGERPPQHERRPEARRPEPRREERPMEVVHRPRREPPADAPPRPEGAAPPRRRQPRR